MTPNETRLYLAARLLLPLARTEADNLAAMAAEAPHNSTLAAESANATHAVLLALRVIADQQPTTVTPIKRRQLSLEPIGETPTARERVTLDARAHF